MIYSRFFESVISPAKIYSCLEFLVVMSTMVSITLIVLLVELIKLLMKLISRLALLTIKVARGILATLQPCLNYFSFLANNAKRMLRWCWWYIVDHLPCISNRLPGLSVVTAASSKNKLDAKQKVEFESSSLANVIGSTQPFQIRDENIKTRDVGSKSHQETVNIIFLRITRTKL